MHYTIKHDTNKLVNIYEIKYIVLNTLKNNITNIVTNKSNYYKYKYIL